MSGELHGCGDAFVLVSEAARATRDAEAAPGGGSSAPGGAARLGGLFLEQAAMLRPEAAAAGLPDLRRGARSPDPLDRARALRALALLRHAPVAAEAVPLFLDGLEDGDPFVRRAAAGGCPALCTSAPEQAAAAGVPAALRGLLADPNASVVASAAAALQEISQRRGGAADAAVPDVTPNERRRLLNALGECGEWDQCALLDALAALPPPHGRPSEATHVIEACAPHLNAANPAVALGAAGVVLATLPCLPRDEAAEEAPGTDGAPHACVVSGFVRATVAKLSAPLLAMVSFPRYDVQWVGLRCALLITQRYPRVLGERLGVRAFFCKYNDPLFVKVEKIGLVMALTTPENVDQVLLELGEYARDVCPELVRRAVRAIGELSVQMEEAAAACVEELLCLIGGSSGDPCVVQEAAVAVRDVLRRYPGRFEHAIAALSDNVEKLRDPRARAALLWILGEYADRIDNVEEILDYYLATFDAERPLVQLALLTAAAKAFLKRGGSAEAADLLQAVLQRATEECEDPDVRDRAMMYWRLLSGPPETAADVVLAPVPPLSGARAWGVDPALCAVLTSRIPRLSAVLGQMPNRVVCYERVVDDVSPLGGGGGAAAETQSAPGWTGNPAENPDSTAPPLIDLLGAAPPSSPPPKKPEDPLAELYGAPMQPATGTPSSRVAAPAPLFQPFGKAADEGAPPQLVLGAAEGRGLEIRARLLGDLAFPASLSYEMTFENRTPSPLDGFMVQFNQNWAGLAPREVALPVALPPGGRATYALPLAAAPGRAAGPPGQLQVAVRNNQQLDEASGRPRVFYYVHGGILAP